MAAVLPVRGGYLVSAEVSGLTAAVRMFFVDQKGILQKQWDESTGALYSPYTISLHAVGKTAYLLSSGNVKLENPGDFGDGYVEVPYGNTAQLWILLKCSVMKVPCPSHVPFGGYV